MKEIKAAGGKAIANYDSVEEGERIIDAAIQNFGRIDVLINNAGIVRKKPFGETTDDDYEAIVRTHIRGAYKCARAAWPHFRKQKYGRVINTSSIAGLFGSDEHPIYSAAKSAMIGFTETLAKEGFKYNIFVNAISPFIASRMTEMLPREALDRLGPEWVVPLVAVLVHSSNKKETGGLFEVGGGHMAKIRWERAKGALLKTDDSMTPGALVKKWAQVSDFSEPEYPMGPADFVTLLEEASKMGSNDRGEDVSLKGRVAVITGAGGGYVLLLPIDLANHPGSAALMLSSLQS